MTVVIERDVSLLANPRFRRLLEARLLGQAAQNAMLYALLILVVEDTGSSIHSTLLIVAITLPSIVIGIPAGAVADMIPKRFTLTFGYLLRGLIVAALAYYSSDIVYIYLLAAASSTVGQFFTPAESATVPTLVRRDQLPAANSLMVLSLIMAQIGGMVVIAPFLIKILGAEAVFIVCTLLFFGATYVIGWMASGFTREEDEKPPTPGFVEAMREGFQILRTNRQAYLAILYLITAIGLSRVLVILLPQYTKNVLGIAAEDTVFVAAPGAIGAALGLLVAPILARWFGAWRIVAFGFVLFLLGLISLGLVVYVRDLIQTHLDLGITFVEERVGVSSVITVTMLLAVPLGFAFTLVSVAARVVLNEQAPQEAQGRVFAVQMALGDFLSLMPLLLVGVVADLVGVRATLLASAAAVLAGAGYLTFSDRIGPPAGPPRAAPEAAPQPG